MPLYNVPNMTGEIDSALVETVAEVPSFIPMFLFFIFCMVFLGGSISQKRRTGITDLPMWATIGSIATLLVSLPLTMTGGLIQIDILAIVVTVTIFSGIWLFLSRSRREV